MNLRIKWITGLSGVLAVLVLFWIAGPRIPSVAGLIQSTENPALTGQPRFLTMLGIAVGTLVSEDLACICAGLLVATRHLDFASGTIAAFAGIFIGDMIVFGLGYTIGQPLLRHRWARWFLSRRSLHRAEILFREKGIGIILLTRFIPGTRTATYFTAGALHAPVFRFIIAFALAAALWTPFLVGLTSMAGRKLIDIYEVYEAFALPVLLVAGLFLYLVLQYAMPMLTWRGRRRLRGKWIRATRWEYWPVWQVNWLVLLYVLYLGFVRYRRPTLFTAVNPCMPHGGVVGERKGEILANMKGASEALPAWRVIPAGRHADRLTAFRQALAETGLSFPVVLKPDEGQRGLGVRIIRDEKAAKDWFGEFGAPALLQEFVSGNEYGVFYVRRPCEETGRLISITVKQQMEITGNGTDTLEVLIHAHPRAIAMLDSVLDRFDAELERVPDPGERIPLGEIGTHSLGAVFLDGRHLLTPELTVRIDRIAKASPGFYFGRFDIKATDDTALMAGRGLKVLEVNGITSEATHIYDPQHGLIHAWKTLCGQWRMAFEVAEENVEGGAPVSSVRGFLVDVFTGLHRQSHMQGR